MKGEKCGSCVWRSVGHVPWKCEFAVRTGRTRKAESAAGCTWYRRGGAVVEELAVRNTLEAQEAQRERMGLA